MKLKLTREKRLLMWTIFLTAMVQMPTLALSPSINQINTVVFPGRGLSTIQTVMQLPNLISPFITIIAGWLIGKGKLGKKLVISVGLLLTVLTGVLSFIMHSEFWHLVMLNLVLGLGISGYISTSPSLLVDFYEEDERQMISGYQTSFINGGGILLSFFGGLLATTVWYGGYVMLLIALPAAIFALFFIPKAKKPETTDDEEKTEKQKLTLPLDVALYSVFIFVFMLVYSVVGSNISTHIAAMGNTAVSGIVTAVQMCGGVASGLVFGALSRKIGDYNVTVAFTAVFVGMMLLSLFPNSLVVTFIAVFISGTAISLAVPQCMFSTSKVVNATSSALSTSITNCLAPSFGGFFSAMVFTNITTALYGESTVMRYRFVGIVSLVCAVIVAAIVTYRNKRAKA